MNRTIGLGTAAAGIALAGAIGMWTGARLAGGAGDAALGDKVRTYILTHPEVLTEAAERARIQPYRKAIETPFASAWAGNPKADVTLVMFTDYNCPFCRVTAPAIEQLLASDPRLKVVWREMPVLGPQSDSAAAAALAAALAGRYLPFHHALFAGGRPDEVGIAAAAKAAGLAPEGVAAGAKSPEVQAQIVANLSLARQIGIQATPFFVIGNRTFEGAIGYDGLAAAVAEARRNRG